MEETLNKILVKVVDMDERMDSFVTKKELGEHTDKIVGNVDSFVKLHKTLDQELIMLRNKYNRLDDRVVSLEQKMAT